MMTPSTCMMMLAVMYGMHAEGEIENDSKAPPEAGSNNLSAPSGAPS